MDKYLINNTKINLKLFNCLFSKKVQKFTYLGKCRLIKMPEYNFILDEFNVILDDFTNYTIFVKPISLSEITKSLFCYWKFCEENYDLYENSYLNKANLKFTPEKKENIIFQKYSLQLLSKNNKIWKVSDINIIKTKDFNNKNFIFDYKENMKDYLFIAII